VLFALSNRSALSLNYSLRQSADYSRHWVTETQAARALNRTRSMLSVIQREGVN
jgi:hypothetical protein